MTKEKEKENSVIKPKKRKMLEGNKDALHELKTCTAGIKSKIKKRVEKVVVAKLGTKLKSVKNPKK